MPPSVISADGYFTGDRQKRLSRTARLMFPSFFLASDGNARLELNPVRIIGRAFADFIPPVSEDEVIACIKEYAAVGLLFLYEHDGRAYGQWDTQTQWLPRYKTAEDHRNPAPPQDAFDAWRAACRKTKAQQQSEPLRGVLEKFRQDFGNASKTLQKDSGNSPAEFPLGVGVVVGLV